MATLILENKKEIRGRAVESIRPRLGRQFFSLYFSRGFSFFLSSSSSRVVIFSFNFFRA